MAKDPLHDLAARQAILDCLQRCARGQDRDDVDLIESAYHPDAIEDHGAYRGPSSGVADWAIPLHNAHYRSTQHFLLNHTVEIDGDIAHSETYFLACLDRHDGTGVDVVGGRYVDRFECRAGEWLIAGRVVVREWDATMGVGRASDGPPAALSYIRGVRGLGDISYQRPLVVDCERP